MRRAQNSCLFVTVTPSQWGALTLFPTHRDPPCRSFHCIIGAAGGDGGPAVQMNEAFLSCIQSNIKVNLSSHLRTIITEQRGGVEAKKRRKRLN